jgi:hypothetical protein
VPTGFVGTALRSIFKMLRSAKFFRRPILKPVGSHFPIYLGFGVFGYGVCLHSSCLTDVSDFLDFVWLFFWLFLGLGLLWD